LKNVFKTKNSRQKAKAIWTTKGTKLTKKSKIKG